MNQMSSAKYCTAAGILATAAALSVILAGCRIVTTAETQAGRTDSSHIALPPTGPVSGAPPFAIVIHGGAGTIDRAKLTPELEQQYHATLKQALDSGYGVLERGGKALDAVEAAINVMEDSPLFNAGKGAVFTATGINELDASIMDGSNLAAGSVAGVRHVKNPISLARMVMEQSPHVMMVGAGAESFAKSKGMPLVDSTYFFTERRWKSYQEARKKADSINRARADSAARARARASHRSSDTTTLLVTTEWEKPEKWGTVGAVALDRNGNLAAGTSTGGMGMKMWGRVGDSPIIGAGTYANNASCAVSATGHGEYFIRNNVAADICARVLYSGVSLTRAADDVIMKRLVLQKGEGGVIAMDRRGNIAMPFNSSGMYRGSRTAGGEAVTKIFKE
jgi:beta-aspartyl-peptidase (threonine type)